MINVNKLVKVYNKNKGNEFEALSGISFQIEEGEMVAITGKSGAGKSTLLHVLSCIDSYEEGEYFINDKLVKDLDEKELAKVRNENIGMVMQDFALVDDFTSLENVMIPLSFSRKKIKDKKERALSALRDVGIPELKNKETKQLSGGQKQRVAIARTIANNPSIILADEPTGSLDSKTSEEILNLFTELNKKGKTVVIVTHDLEVANICSRTIELSDGLIIEDTGA